MDYIWDLILGKKLLTDGTAERRTYRKTLNGDDSNRPLIFFCQELKKVSTQNHKMSEETNLVVCEKIQDITKRF